MSLHSHCQCLDASKSYLYDIEIIYYTSMILSVRANTEIGVGVGLRI